MAEAADPTCQHDVLQAAMINRLIRTDAHFKHQQIGEPDLSPAEKTQIALAVLQKGLVIFLERFSKFLTLEDVPFFSNERTDYAVNFYLSEIEHRCKDTKQNIVKNRRYQALQELMDEGEYFSQDEMQWRDPLLFEQMVGQYMDESEQEGKSRADIDKSDLKFSTILLKHMDLQASKQYYGDLKETEDEQLEESDDDSDEEDSGMESNNVTAEEKAAMEIERNHMHGEFVRIMQERFLAGDDKNFDYSRVDYNTDYDSLDILGHDAEERYFDDEDDDLDVTPGNLCADVGKRLEDINLCDANEKTKATSMCSSNVDSSEKEKQVPKIDDDHVS